MKLRKELLIELVIGTGLIICVWAFAWVCAWTLAKGAI
jgi:hypothetical protein